MENKKTCLPGIFLKEKYDKGFSIEIPSLNISINKKEIKMFDDETNYLEHNKATDK